MHSKAPNPALFEAPLEAEDLGGYDALGRLVAAASLHGVSPTEMAEKAAVAELSYQLGVNKESALTILRGLKKHGER